MWFCLYWTRCGQSGHERSRLASSKADWSNFEGNRHKHWGKIKTNQEPGRAINSRNRSTSQLKRKLSKFVKKWKGLFNGQIYHGCGWRYVDLGGKLINFEIGEKCLLPTSTPFSEEPTDNRMHIRWLKKGRLIHGLIKNVDEITNNWQF